MRISRGIGLTLWLAASSLSAQAESAAVTGTLTLSGRVLAEPCRTELDDRQLSLTCPVTEQTRTEQVSISILQQGESSILTAAQVDYRWIDPAHTMAIIAISHD
jgi:type 1 fimbria pilin